MALLFDLRWRVKIWSIQWHEFIFSLILNLNSLVTPDPDTTPSNNMTTDYYSAEQLCSNSVMGKPNWSSGGSAEVGRY